VHRVRHLVIAVAVVALSMGMASAPAYAKWGPKINCGIKTEPKNEHCYAIAEYPAVSAAETAGLPSGNVGFLVGQLYVSDKPAPGRYVFVGSMPMPRLATRHKTGQHGVFSFRLSPGHYYVKVGKSDEGFCGATAVTVTRHKYTKVELHCSK
jgi:hypothetical protein